MDVLVIYSREHVETGTKLFESSFRLIELVEASANFCHDRCSVNGQIPDQAGSANCTPAVVAKLGPKGQLFSVGGSTDMSGWPAHYTSWGSDHCFEVAYDYLRSQGEYGRAHYKQAMQPFSRMVGRICDDLMPDDRLFLALHVNYKDLLTTELVHLAKQRPSAVVGWFTNQPLIDHDDVDTEILKQKHLEELLWEMHTSLENVASSPVRLKDAFETTYKAYFERLLGAGKNIAEIGLKS